MPQSLAKLLTPIVFSPKDRYPYLDAAVRPELHAYAATVLQGCDSPAITINSVTDHIHLVCALSRKWRLCDVVEELKVGTSKGIKTKGGMLPKFHWQNGYAAFSVASRCLPASRSTLPSRRSITGVAISRMSFVNCCEGMVLSSTSVMCGISGYFALSGAG